MSTGCSGKVRRTTVLTAAAALVAAGLTAGGCQQHAGAGHSAAEATVNRPSASLEFFDELERRPFACQDDLLHGLLLVAGGDVPASAAARAEAARRAGIVAPDYRRRPLDQVTVHEAAVAAARSVGGAGARDFAAWTDQATDWAKRSGLVPAEARAGDALTGAQLLAILGGVSDMRAARPAGGADAAPAPTSHGAVAPVAQAPADDDFDKFTTTPAARPAPALTPAPAPAAARTGPAARDLPQARREPVPEMKPVAASAVTPEAPASAPAPAAPTRAASTPEPTPSPAPPAPVVVPKPKANPWTSGRPITSTK